MYNVLIGACILALVSASAVSAQTRYRYDGASRANIEALGSSRVEQLPIPILGISLSSLTKNFGDPREGGTRSHEGLDIMAPQDTPIASPTDAVVTRTGNGSGSGIYVRTANPGGETFVYMHLSKVASNISEGTALKRGDLIGFVGNTGNASGGAPHLHLEIRNGRTPTDPYPRLTSVFTAEEYERIATAARAQGVSISTPTTSVNSSALLKEGDSGAKVVQLQTFLIAKNAGPAAGRLAAAGATGYFGAITVAALREYQAFVSTPVTGYVDAATNSLVFTSATEGESDEATEDIENGPTTPTTPSTSPAVQYSFTRDLERDMEGADVRALQVFLNTHSFLVAQSGVGSPGNETTFFGPATQAALIRFQKALSITPAAGYFGPKTRAAVNAL
jgi:peptidoglycan hydrolase-like protein with peptidoglycan-binding domain